MDARASSASLVTFVFVCAVAAPVSAQSAVVVDNTAKFDTRAGASFLQVEAGEFQTLALRTDGTVVAWGATDGGACAVPAFPAGVTCSQVSAGRFLSAALLSDGSVRTWGVLQLHEYAPSGLSYVQVDAGPSWPPIALRSDGVAVTFNGPQPPSLPPGVVAVEVDVGNGFYLARLSDGTIAAWGGTNTYGELNVPPLPSGLSYVEVDAGFAHAIARRSDGSAVAWGRGWFGELNVPPLPPGDFWVHVDAGNNSCAAIDNHGVAWAWGENFSGQCDMELPPAGLTYVGLSMGRAHTIAMRSDGELVYAGNRNKFERNVPANGGIAYTGFAGDQHVLLLSADGSVQAGGSNLHGECDVPGLPPGLVYTQVAGGAYRSAALRSDGAIIEWGATNGLPPTLAPGVIPIDLDVGTTAAGALLSDGTIVTWGSCSSTCTPPPLPPGVTYVELEAGDHGFFARRSDGAVVAWDETPEQAVPPALPSSTVIKLAAGNKHVLALLSDGSIVAWGDGTHWQTVVPVLPAGVTYVDIAAHRDGSVALRSDGQVVGWGTASSQWPPIAPAGHHVAQIDLILYGIAARFEPDCPPPSIYCTAKTNSLGCVPVIAFTGQPSASATSGFEVTSSNVRNQKVGMLLYGLNGPAAIPFQGGTLCVTSPARRTVGTSSGGSLAGNDCTGVYALDFNEYARGLLGGNPHAALGVAGTLVDAQWWGRDPGFPPPDNTTLSNGVHFEICPR